MYGSVILFLLLLNLGAAEATAELCYILDGILIIYGIVLTVLYCRLRMRSGNNATNEEKPEDLYQGLQHKNQDTYETINVKRKQAFA